ncbi:MAG TPA: 5'-methylthioadenosine/S-adenosylhomocysteine nucleosidase [Candidatus Dormibacteraeota bacterium]|nr:5'-methylthioadenosine/S-adenosylhomocysteine nucleosidase [Candidatus Dormibacteraeota bacterium]
MPVAPLAIFAALEMEAGALVRNLPRSETIGPKIATWEGDGMVVVVGGVGKVAAALAAQFTRDAFKPRGMISIGLAGAARDESARGHVVIATGAVQHDMDGRPLTGKRGVIPGLGMSTFAADGPMMEKLTIAAKRAVENPRVVRTGLVMTGDQIVTSRAVRDALARDFPEGACIDMETAAVAQVAHQNGLPWGAVRVVSDSADEAFNLEEVIDFGVNTAGELFARIMLGAAAEL